MAVREEFQQLIAIEVAVVALAGILAVVAVVVMPDQLGYRVLVVVVAAEGADSPHLRIILPLPLVVERVFLAKVQVALAAQLESEVAPAVTELLVVVTKLVVAMEGVALALLLLLPKVLERCELFGLAVLALPELSPQQIQVICK